MSRHKFSVRLLRAALDDLNDMLEFVALDSKSAAESLVNRIEKRLMTLEKYPYLGHLPRERELMQLGYRFLVIGNYVGFYTIEGHVVLVHRVLHGARDYMKLM